MRKPVFVVIFALLSLNGPSDAAVWIQVGAGQFIDTLSIQQSSQSYTFWVKSNYKERDSDGSLSSKYQMTINCKRKEHIGRYWIDYDDIDNTGKVLSATALDGKWTPIPPDSTAELFMKFLCR